MNLFVIFAYFETRQRTFTHTSQYAVSCS